MQTIVSTELAQHVRRQCGENVFLCYQCQKCSAGCPVAEYFDLAPNQLMRALQLGQREMVLKSRTIWLCAMCETCAVRCPHDINITRVMDLLKIMAVKEGLSRPLPTAVLFNRAAMRGIRTFGKMFEAGLMGEVYLRQMMEGTLDYGQLFRNDLPLAVKMVAKGKLKLLPSFGKIDRKGEDAPREKTLAYYPGCSLHGTSREYDRSVRAVLAKLEVPFEEPRQWICCGSTPAHSTDKYLSVLLPLKNLHSMEKAGFSSVTTPCPSCFIRLRAAQEESGNAELGDGIAAELGGMPSPDFKVDHLLETLTREVGYERIRQKIVRPLRGMKVVCYYGCIITRPPRLTGVRDYENPSHMDRLMGLLGAQALPWSYKTKCCGGSLSISQPGIALELTRKILQSAKKAGADAVVVACPLCQINLDARQKQISDAGAGDLNLPIVYFTQLMGLAFGIGYEDLELDKHFTDPRAITGIIAEVAPLHQGGA